MKREISYPDLQGDAVIPIHVYIPSDLLDTSTKYSAGARQYGPKSRGTRTHAAATMSVAKADAWNDVLHTTVDMPFAIAIGA